MEDAMLGKEETVHERGEAVMASGEDPKPASTDGSPLLGTAGSALLGAEEARAEARRGPEDAVPEADTRAVGDGAATVGKDKLLIVIPAYDEGGRVGGVVGDVRRKLPWADVLVIDDGSQDDTSAEAARAGAIVVSLPTNGGYGTALQTGYKYAVRHGYDLHRAEFLTTMLDVLREDGADVVVGSRFLARDGHYRTPLARSLGIRLFARLASLATGHRVTDPTSGFQVMRCEIARLFTSDVFPVDYPDADILILLHRTGHRVREVPVQMRPSPGASMHSTQNTPYYVYKMLLSILVTLLRPRTKTRR